MVCQPLRWSAASAHFPLRGDEKMPGTVRIENLRNIRRLEFDLPAPGAWLLTAANGAGKTTLLASLRRIGNANAFPIHFPSSLESEQLDNYSRARLVYEVGGEEVEYAYRGERWAPRPRRNSHLLRRFGYPSVIYLGATADRLTPRPEDFVPRRARNAGRWLIAAANQIFETNKFDDLKVINLTTGVGNQAFLLKVADDPVQYHSEKQFSLGELCILKLVRSLRNCPNRSLVLIDELEMALHPRAQIQLYRYLEQVSRDKNLTVIFSTHSVSLLKSVSRRRSIFLERDDENNVTPIVGCFPTYAIGNIALGEEHAPDVVLYVEDEVSRSIVEALVKLTINHKYDDDSLFPGVKIVPIGGFPEVVRFLSQHGAILPPGTSSFALLDNDVREETLATWQANQNYDQLRSFARLGDRIDYLPWTPEVGIVTYLRDERLDAERRLRRHFSDPHININISDLSGLHGLAGAPLRRMSKQVLSRVCETISRSVAKDVNVVSQGICEVFAQRYFASSRSAVLRLLGRKLD